MPVYRHLVAPRPRRGAALIEYALLLGLIAVGAIGAVSGLGDKIDTSFNQSSAALGASVLDPGQNEDVEDLYVGDPYVAYTRPANADCVEIEGAFYSNTPGAHGYRCIIATNPNPGYAVMTASDRGKPLFVQAVGYYDRIFSGDWDDTLVVQPTIETGRQYTIGNPRGKDILVIPDWTSNDVTFEYLPIGNTRNLGITNKVNGSVFIVRNQMTLARANNYGYDSFIPFHAIRLKDRAMNGEDIKAKMFQDDPNSTPEMFPYQMSPYND